MKDLNQLSQKEFEAIMNALIMLKQTNPDRDIYLNEKWANYVIQIMMNKLKK